MPPLTILTLKFGTALCKILYGLKTGDHKIASEAFLKTAEAQGIEKAKLLAPQTTLTSILSNVAKQLEDNPEWKGTKEEQEEAAAEAGETLGKGFSFDTLAENLKTPERLANLWVRVRLSDPPTTITALQIRHDLLLQATAIALVEHLTELSGFQNWYVGYIVRNFGDVLNKARTHKEALDALHADVRDFLGKQGVEDALFEQKYRKALIRNHNKVELFIEEKRLDSEYVEQTLTVAYVTLSLSHGRTEQQRDDIGFVSADNLLNKQEAEAPNVFVIGKAGCGKTTLLRWLAIQAAQTGLPPEPDLPYRLRLDRIAHDPHHWREKVPLLVRLRLWETEGMPTPEQFLTKGEKYDGVPSEWALRILNAGRGLVLLDGLDELSTEKRKEALNWIEGLVEDYPNGNVFVASSRPQAVKARALHKAGFQEYEVQELSSVGRREFVNNSPYAGALPPLRTWSSR